jgi:hypothetical protein
VCSFTNPGESVGLKSKADRSMSIKQNTQQDLMNRCRITYTLELCTLDSNRSSRDLPSWYAASTDACRSTFTQWMTYTFWNKKRTILI